MPASAYQGCMMLAEKMGWRVRPSALLKKAADLGLGDAAALESLAVARGCWHYRHPQLLPPPSVAEFLFSNEELAVALLSPNQPYSPHTIRVGAAMLGAQSNNPDTLATLAQVEGCDKVVRYVAQAATQFEADNPFWSELLARLPETAPPTEGVLPHPTRFVSMTGFTRSGPGRVAVWIRPRPEFAVRHG
jgi:hypothetical protein